MKTTILILSICAMAVTTGCNTLHPSDAADIGVVINGVRWATRNVAAPGIFADKPEDAGMFYQWNRKKAWSSEGDTVENWDSSMAEGTEWEKANDPSPSGWRVPTREEILSLLDTAKVNSEWITQNEVNGYKFTDKTTGNSIFLPAAGFRGSYDDTLNYVDSYGIYWSSTQHGIDGAYFLGFDSYVSLYGDSRRFGSSVRCVAE